MIDGGLDLHDFRDEGFDDLGGYPGGAETRGDFAGFEIDRLNRLERGGDGMKAGIGFSLLTRKGELGAHGAR